MDKIKMMGGLDVPSDKYYKRYSEYPKSEYNRTNYKSNYRQEYTPHKEKNYRFTAAEIGDYVKFKNISDEKKDKMRQGIFVKDKYSVYYGIVTDVSDSGHLGLQIDERDKRMDYPNGLTVWIDRRAVLQIYPKKLVEHITPRLALKHIWKDLVFREVKTTKFKTLKYVDYHYVNKSGFSRVKRFRTLEEAKKNVKPEFYDNLSVHYEEYFGFTYDKALRDNDKHFDREIFFSKKCYSELDFTDNPTGDFLINERAFNDIPIRPGAMICGIVENGEKGLFFRKWFVCSPEFLLLWTMISDPKDSSLRETTIPNISFEHLRSSEEFNMRKKKKVKSFDKLLTLLDTSSYDVDLKQSVEERQRRFRFYNLERTAMYFHNRYVRIAEIIFSSGFSKLSESSSRSYSDDYQDDYTPFQKKLIRNLLWMKKIR